MTAPPGVTVALPGGRPIRLTHAVLDFTGTLSRDGRLLPGVAPRLRLLARCLRVIVATADTFGAAGTALDGLPVELVMIRAGRDKVRLLERIGPARVLAVGNGRNDAPMLRCAAIGIAVIGPEGAAGRAIADADVVVRDIRDALELPLHPLRLTATLRR